MSTDRKPRLRSVGALIALACGAGAAWAQSDAAAQALAEKHQCMSCHKVTGKHVGPSFADIAGKYRGNAQAAETLFQKVRNGGRGVWGHVPMPSHKDVPEQDIKDLVSWVLSLPKS